jgi:hypothetical protein
MSGNLSPFDSFRRIQAIETSTTDDPPFVTLFSLLEYLLKKPVTQMKSWRLEATRQSN